jgi:cytochrome c oxidase subunit II
MNKNFLGTPLIASEHGAALDSLTWYIHILMFALFIGWAIYFLYVLFRFRRSRNPQADHLGVRSHFSTYVEVGVAVTEAVLLIGFAVPLWARNVEKFPPEKESVVIRVAGRQFNWIARYPGADREFGKQDIKMVSANNPFGADAADAKGADDVTVLTGSEIAVPVNTNVIMHITSMDVIHSFKVFPMRVNQDATPGMSVPIHFKPIRIGDYPINCAQLCGVGHYSMQGVLKVLSPADYEAWLASKRGTGGAGAASEFE